MAATEARAQRRRVSLAVAPFERGLSAGAVVLLAFVIAALVRGRAHWAGLPGLIGVHLLTIVGALALTPVMLLRRRGDRLHRVLGWMWVLCLGGTAAISFGIRTINPGGFSLIHALSAFTLLMMPVIVWAARTHRIAVHRITVCSMVAGALLIARFFTFPFDRLLGRWLFG